MVSELGFGKTEERQVNKFNRLLLKKQGDITWFSTVPPTQAGNPWVGNPLSEIALSLPGQSVLIPRQPVPLPGQSALTPRQSLLMPRQPASLP